MTFATNSVAELVERHSKQLVPEFFAFLAAHVRDFEEADEELEETEKAADVEMKETEEADEDEEDEEEEEVAGAKKKRKAATKRKTKSTAVVVSSKKRAAGAERERETLSAKGATDRLLTWLSLFAQFRNPRGLFQSDKLHATFTKYASSSMIHYLYHHHHHHHQVPSLPHIAYVLADCSGGRIRVCSWLRSSAWALGGMTTSPRTASASRS